MDCCDFRSSFGIHQTLWNLESGDKMTRKHVGIVLFNDVEVLDFCGPFEVFSATRLNEDKRREELSPFNVFLVAETLSNVTTTGGMTVLPHCSFENCPRLDILVVPGGWGVRKELNNPVMLEWLRSKAAAVETLTAVCTGSMLLGSAGLLNGLHATTHWRSLDWMRDVFPAVIVESGQHVVEDGRVFTSAGISAGIDMALKVVARYYAEGIARATARHMEYAWPMGNERRINIEEQPADPDAGADSI
jgi:transcriptional regulator GlxA family with amidase domain